MLPFFTVSDSLPDLKRSWDNLMWNLEIDDDDYDSEKQMKAAMDGVLASLVEVGMSLSLAACGSGICGVWRVF